ncbi:hypothetical protein HYC85_018280 [Camellia sinensis]|uniref:Secreted protein n=1 Tax=Camellia sinensis TaxID=4442 RepID=A0A7J7GTW6_CAMSI|nr:hypothetical protein HYC85_018280 [Camellia sinensis]
MSQGQSFLLAWWGNVWFVGMATAQGGAGDYTLRLRSQKIKKSPPPPPIPGRGTHHHPLVFIS